MKVRPIHFNIILLLLALVAGCQTEEKKKEFTALRLHIEANANTSERKTVSVCRAAPVAVVIDASPFVDERDLTRARVVDWMGGYALQLEFNAHGKIMLENTTRLTPGRRIAVAAEFGETRWLGAPLIGRPISDGQLTFTPDATRAEAVRIALGLNNAAEAVRKNTYK